MAARGSFAANRHPDHDSLAFRKRFLKEIEALFVQVLGIAREMKLLKLGTVALDGTKIHANASRASARSHGHAQKLEAQLQAEVKALLARAEAAVASAAWGLARSAAPVRHERKGVSGSRSRGNLTYGAASRGEGIARAR